MFFRNRTSDSTGDYSAELRRLHGALDASDAVVVGAGAGLSTAAGYVYAGERFEKYFADLARKYGFQDMYTGGFTPFATPEERWAYWSRNIYINRYAPIPKPTYEHLGQLLKGKDYFVLTTNVDHCFQRAGFDKKRLFYTQGDYGLWQCSEPCHQATYDNRETVEKMLLAQGFVITPEGELTIPAGTTLKTEVPTELVPRCPRCGKPMTMNLRSDDTFVEDEGWHRAAKRYADFLRTRAGKVLYLELGVGYNTPGIIKYPFWNMTYGSEEAAYACVNFTDARCPREIRDRSITLEADVDRVLRDLLQEE